MHKIRLIDQRIPQICVPAGRGCEGRSIKRNPDGLFDVTHEEMMVIRQGFKFIELAGESMTKAAPNMVMARVGKESEPMPAEPAQAEPVKAKKSKRPAPAGE